MYNLAIAVLETISSDLWWNREVCQTSK